MTTGVPFFNLFQMAGRKVGLDPRLLASVARQESNFNPQAVSPVGAQGVMQLMPATAKELGVDDPFDPQQNILGGAAYLKQQLDRFDGDTELALAAYNAGPIRVQRAGGDLSKLPEETQQYVPNVMANFEELTPAVDTRTAQRVRPQQKVEPEVPQRVQPEAAEELSSLDRRLMGMMESRPEALEALRASEEPPKLKELGPAQRAAVAAGARLFGMEPQGLIDRGWELARRGQSEAAQQPEPEADEQPSGDPRRFFSNLTAARMDDVMQGRIQSPFDQKPDRSRTASSDTDSSDEEPLFGDLFLPAMDEGLELPPPVEQPIAEHPRSNGQPFPVPERTQTSSRLQQEIIRRITERRRRLGGGMMG